MDFRLSPEIDALRLRVRAFVADHILPVEADKAAWDEHENIAQEPLKALQARARAEGLWNLPLPPEHGGLGVGMVGMAACYEEMNRSLFGPVCFNSAAPDDGTMMLLAKVARPDQQARWLAPIAEPRVR